VQAQQLFTDTFSPVVSPMLKISAPAQLREATLIHFEWHNPGPAAPTWPAWLADAGLPPDTGAGHLHFSQETHAIDAALAGRGVAILSHRLVEDDIRAHRLATPFGPSLTGPSYFILSTARATTNKNVDAVRSWLCNAGQQPAA